MDEEALAIIAERWARLERAHPEMVAKAIGREILQELTLVRYEMKAIRKALNGGKND